MARKKTKLVDKEDYDNQLYELQVELVKLQHHLLKTNQRVLLILEGRDGAGKDGAIKRLTEHMSPRDTRVHAPGKPSDREETQWYFQRFIPYLPSGDEFVIFNRSWYNRAGVESVMGFATEDQVDNFLENVVPFEAMLVRDGIHLRKYYSQTSRMTKTEEAAEGSRAEPAEALEDLADRCGGRPTHEMERVFEGAGQDAQAHQPARRRPVADRVQRPSRRSARPTNSCATC